MSLSCILAVSITSTSNHRNIYLHRVLATPPLHSPPFPSPKPDVCTLVCAARHSRVLITLIVFQFRSPSILLAASADGSKPNISMLNHPSHDDDDKPRPEKGARMHSDADQALLAHVSPCHCFVRQYGMIHDSACFMYHIKKSLPSAELCEVTRSCWSMRGGQYGTGCLRAPSWGYCCPRTLAAVPTSRPIFCRRHHDPWEWPTSMHAGDPPLGSQLHPHGPLPVANTRRG